MKKISIRHSFACAMKRPPSCRPKTRPYFGPHPAWTAWPANCVAPQSKTCTSSATWQSVFLDHRNQLPCSQHVHIHRTMVQQSELKTHRKCFPKVLVQLPQHLYHKVVIRTRCAFSAGIRGIPHLWPSRGPGRRMAVASISIPEFHIASRGPQGLQPLRYCHPLPTSPRSRHVSAAAQLLQPPS